MSPVQQWSDGQLHGHLRARDAEGEQLSYSVLVAPEYGSVELDQQGFYKYIRDTPVESGLAVPDSFVLAVSDPPGGSHLITGDTGTARSRPQLSRCALRCWVSTRRSCHGYMHGR